MHARNLYIARAALAPNLPRAAASRPTQAPCTNDFNSQYYATIPYVIENYPRLSYLISFHPIASNMDKTNLEIGTSCAKHISAWSPSLGAPKTLIGHTASPCQSLLQQPMQVLR